jgi:nicotinamide-nucleotide amidase
MTSVEIPEPGAGAASLRAEVVTIGDELLSGAIVDTNSSLIAEKLLGLGISVWRMTSVGDESTGIVDLLREVAGRSHLGIVSGGLGPTEDDRTSQAVAEAFGRPLALHEPSLRKIRELFERLGFEMTPNNERQAWIPQGAQVIPNRMGTAPGFALEVGGCLLAFLPGVPRELEAMLDEGLLPLLESRVGLRGRVASRTLKLFGVTEAKLDQMVRGALDGLPGTSLASLPRFPENRLRVTVRARGPKEAMDLLQEAERRLRERVGPWVYGVDDEELESVVQGLLRRQGKTLAVAESCTGGLVAHRLTNIAGSSDVLERAVVAYSLRAKEELLGVPRELLEREGPVSGEAARAMARGARERAGTTIGLSVTGIAGPSGGSEETPVGTVFMGLAEGGRSFAQRFWFRGGRGNVKTMASNVALDWLRRYLLGEDPCAYPGPWR